MLPDATCIREDAPVHGKRRWHLRSRRLLPPYPIEKLVKLRAVIAPKQLSRGLADRDAAVGCHRLAVLPIHANIELQPRFVLTLAVNDKRMHPSGANTRPIH